jgi:hypothetical protein
MGGGGSGGGAERPGTARFVWEVAAVRGPVSVQTRFSLRAERWLRPTEKKTHRKTEHKIVGSLGFEKPENARFVLRVATYCTIFRS